MENTEVLHEQEKNILGHIADNFALMLKDDAKIKVDDYKDVDCRRLVYYWKVLREGKWIDISYELKIFISRG